MNIGLACYEFRNNDIQYNIHQIEEAVLACKDNVDLLCFGEAFLQGFDSLSWNYEKDSFVAVSQDSEYFEHLKNFSKKHRTDLAFGYMEQYNEAIYSSYAVIIDGTLAYNTRRITKNWKEYTKTNEHYKEGTEVLTFPYKEHQITVSLCGDLWIIPERFRTDGILLWPIYCNFPIDAWLSTEQYEYARQAGLVAKDTLLVSSISKEPPSAGGAMYFRAGKIKENLAFDTEGILVIRF